MNFLNTANKIRSNTVSTLKHIGWLDTCLYVLCRLLAIISRNKIRIFKYYLMAQPVAEVSLLPKRRGRSINIRLIHEQDAVIQQFPRPKNIIQERFKSGAKCLVAFKDEEFIGFLWLQFDSYQEDEVRARFIPMPIKKTAWDFDVYVKPECRLGLTFARLWDEANKLLRDNDICWTCSRISAFNSASLKPHKNLGAETLGSALFFCVSKWQVSLASLYPYFQLSSRSDSFPEYYLNAEILNNPSLLPQKGEN